MKQIFSALHYFCVKHIHSEWMKEASETKIEEILLCAVQVEKVCNSLKNKKCLTELENKFSEWRRLKHNMSVECRLLDMVRACDLVLKGFLTNPGVPHQVAVSAVTHYLRLCGDARYQLLKENLVLENHTHEAVSSLMEEISTVCAPKVGCQVLQSMLMKNVQCGSGKETVAKLCEDTRFLEALLRILLLDNQVKALVKKALISKMRTEIRRNITFWSSFTSADRSVMIAVCELHPEVLKEVISFIVYFGESMEFEVTETDCVWKVGRDMMMAGLHFDSLVGLVKSLLESQGTAAVQMKDKLQDLKLLPGCSVWVEVERQSGLPVLAKDLL